jgi:hypothetical protein
MRHSNLVSRYYNTATIVSGGLISVDSPGTDLH